MRFDQGLKMLIPLPRLQAANAKDRQDGMLQNVDDRTSIPSTRPDEDSGLVLEVGDRSRNEAKWHPPGLFYNSPFFRIPLVGGTRKASESPPQEDGGKQD